MVTLNPNLTDLFTEYEPLVDEVVLRLARKYPAIRTGRIDADSLGRAALWHAVEKFDSSRASFPTFAKMVISRRLLEALAVQTRKRRAIESAEFRVMTERHDRDFDDLYAALDKLPADAKEILVWEFGLTMSRKTRAEISKALGIGTRKTAERVEQAMAMLREVLS